MIHTTAFRHVFVLLFSIGFIGVGYGQTVFINEIHYDDNGGDLDEGIEIAGPAGTNLSGWSIAAYNGSNSATYSTQILTGIIPDEGCGYGSLWFDIAGLQNGAPDGVALSDDNNVVIQFLSYEGNFTANDGPANGLTSIDIGVSETNTTAVGTSLQLIGTGTVYSDFSWSSSSTHSRGTVNSAQDFCIVTNTTVQFSSATFSEDENITTVDLCVDITNEDANPTTVNVALTSATGLFIPSFVPQTLTFPASSGSQQCATITWADNGNCDGNETYIFELQNEMGGDAVTIGPQGTTELTIVDDEQNSGTIAFQGFEGSGWGYNLSTPECVSGGDIWSPVSNISSIIPSTGLSFFGIQDLNGDCGGSSFETITLNNINTTGYTDLIFSFDYNVIGFDAGDDIKYELVIDGVGQGEVLLVDGNSNFTTSGWITEIINYSGAATTASIVISVQQNGDDYAGFDNITLSGTGCITCEEPTTEASFHTISLTDLTETSALLDWNSGDGDNNLIVLKEGSNVTANPMDGTTYNANPAFGLGTDLGTGEFAVYSGNAETVTITNLTPGTAYFAEIFEYSCLPGNEDYLTSGTPDTDNFITLPENPATFVEDCVGATSINLTWTAPANGNYDGYLLIAREGAAPHSVNGLDPSTQTFDLDFTSAPTFGATTEYSRVLYNGTGLSANVSGLTNGVSYTFEIFAYTIESSDYIYSVGTTTSQTIELADISGLSATPSATSVELSWSIDLSCVDEVIVVAYDVGGVTSIPSGTGYTVSSNAYTDVSNPTLPGGEKVVYSGLGLTTTITDLTTETEYCFKIFIRKGSSWSNGEELCETPRAVTFLQPGDISIVAINTDISSSDDEICFFSYKSITTGTTIDLTDNGYERESSNLWGETEGVIRIERTGTLIPAGTTICIRGSDSPSNFSVNTCGIDDGGWIISAVNNSFNLNGTDQVWILQGGLWSNPSGSHNATYTGNVIYGWTATGWQSDPGYGSTSGSTLYPSSQCFNTDLQLGGDKVKYTGDMSETNRINWILRINDENNWTSYPDNGAYNSASPDYWGTCVEFDISSTIYSEGIWTGDADNDWFECRNWQNLTVPTSAVNVTLDNTTNQPMISEAGAECLNLDINPSASLTLNDPTSELSIGGNLSVEGSLINTGGTIVFNGIIDQNITDSLVGVSTLNINNITIDKPIGVLNNLESLSISGLATFNNGILFPGPSTNIIFGVNATVSGASNASYIEGKVQKTADTSTDFTFPIGDSNADGDFYQPARIFDLLSGISTFEAQYFAEANPYAGPYYDGESNSPNDNHEIGNCDYWTVNKLSGSENVRIGLKFTNDNSQYCNDVSDPIYMRIASLNSSNQWDILDTGDSPEEITMNVRIGEFTGGSYGDFAFYSTGGQFLNVLPIDLLSFDLSPLEESVLTTWTTSTEINNDYFTIERSKDAQTFIAIGTVEGAGNSHELKNYSFTDRKPLSGISYYRLKQTDFDGFYSYSEIKSISFDGNDDFKLELVYKNENQLNLIYKATSTYIFVEIFDILGKRLFTDTVENHGGRSVLNTHLQSGAYVVRISSEGHRDSKKFIW